MEKLNSIILSASGVVGVEVAERITSLAPTDIETGIGLLMQIAIAIATIIKMFTKTPAQIEASKEKQRLRKLEREEKKNLK